MLLVQGGFLETLVDVDPDACRACDAYLEELGVGATCPECGDKSWRSHHEERWARTPPLVFVRIDRREVGPWTVVELVEGDG